MKPTHILLKLTGEIFLSDDKSSLSSDKVSAVAQQIKQLNGDYRFGIVIGGGNFFRGSKQGKQMGITSSVGDQVGMLATMMNGLLIKDILEQNDLNATLFCAVPAPEVGIPISQQAIHAALAKKHCLIFSGGTGNPFFTTDTTSILRGLQIQADQVWKGTGVDGVYDKDPRNNPDAQALKKVSYQDALNKNLGIMDPTAFALAGQHKLPIRIFNIFKDNALLKAASDTSFGSLIT